MDKNWKQDYKKFKSDFESFQNEALDFVRELTWNNSSNIDIANIQPRAGGIKSKKSIGQNNKNGRYKKLSHLLNIPDIAGVRIICHCEDDVDNLSTFIEGELRQKYSNVSSKQIGGRNSEYPYRATHITFAKAIKKDGKIYQIFCEIQIRTVMADAWAVQNHKYLYKKRKEGEAHELTNAVSEIMNGCEKLWTLVKKKSIEKKDKYTGEIATIQKKAESSLKTISDKHDLKQWFQSNKDIATNGLKKLKIKTYMEVEIQLLNLDLNVGKKDLKDAARNSTIRTFGWPIGVYLDRQEFSPKPDSNGVHAEISIKEKDWMDKSKERVTYDYWAIHSCGAFYLKKSLFEDSRKPDQIFFNTRIVRITEVFMYIKNLYSKFEVPANTQIQVTIKHGGLKGRILSSSSFNRSLFGEYKIETDNVSSSIITTLDEIGDDVATIVEKFTKLLFEQFEFFELERKVLDDIVLNYLQGKVV